jgi:ABC-2 type transport system permease protein
MTATPMNASTATERVRLTPARTTVVPDTWFLTGRKLRALARQPAVLAMGVIQPVIWLFLFGEMFHKVIDIPGFTYQGSYLGYLIPGIVAMNAMSGNMWAGMSMIDEIDRGTLNRFLVTPASRLAIMNASVVEQAVTTTVQTLIIVGLGYAGGASFPGGAAGFAVLIVAAIEVGVLWGALSNTTGMLLRAREAIIGVYTFFMLPLMFLSSAFMPPGFLPGWMQAIARWNPLNWEVEMGRSALSAAPDWSAIAIRGAGLLILAIACVALSVRTFRSYARNV